MVSVKTSIKANGVIQKQGSPSNLTVKVPMVVSSTADFTNNNLSNVGLINGINLGTLSGSVLPANVIVVAQTGGQHSTINAALTASNSGDVVAVYPGIYEENFAIPSGVRVIGYPAAQNIIISGSGAGTRVVMNDTSTLRECTVIGPDSGDSPIVDMSGLAANELGVLSTVVVQGRGGSGAGVLLDTGTGVFIDLYHNGGALGNLLEVQGGTGVIDNITANAGTANAVLKVSGSGARVIGQELTVTPIYGGAAAAIEIGTSGSVQYSSLLIPNENTSITRGINITGDAVSLDLVSSHIHSIEHDVFVTEGNTGEGTELIFSAVELKVEKVQVPADWRTRARVLGTRLDTGVDNDRAFNILAEFSVGFPGRGFESAFGEGDSSVVGMNILTSGSAGFTNITSEMSSVASGTAALLPDVLSGSALYVGTSGSFIRQFPNIKMDITDIGSTGSGDLCFEYPSGSAGIWKKIDYLVCGADAPYRQKAQRLFSDNESIQIRLDINEFSNWVTSSVDGLSGYWMRMKVSSSLTTPPTGSRIKIGTNRTEINDDGFVEYFGNAEQERRIFPVGLSAVQDLAGASPANAQVAITPVIRLTPVDNRFADGVTDGFGQLLSLSYGIDTSRDLTFRVGWFAEANSTGDVVFQFYNTNNIRTGDNIDSQSLQEIVSEVTESIGSDQSGILRTTDFTFKLPNQEDQTLWAYALRRPGGATADTFGGNIAIAFVECYADWWR